MVAEAMRLYEQRLRSRLEPGHNGEFLIVNLDTGEYELGRDDLTVSQRARQRFGKARLVTLRVGRRAAYRLGGVIREQR